MAKSSVMSLHILLALQASMGAAGLIQNVKNVQQLGELDGSEIKGPNSIRWPRKEGQRFQEELKCFEEFTLVYKDKYAACCHVGENLVGSFDTVWECCPNNHYLAGSQGTGFQCCPTGQIFDGKKCKDETPPSPVCTNGKVLVDGKCVCPSGSTEGSDGWCKVDQVGTCDSGLKTGKCYTFTDDRGLNYGFHNAGWYTASRDSRNHIFGKFQLCDDQECTPGKSVNPNTAIRVKDIHGMANSGANAGQWLDNRVNGDHIRKTADYDKAGKFTLTKWPCGKYCLGGFDAGLGPTCPSDDTSFTFNTGDKQACQVVTLTEVPCDVHAVENNCIWKNGNQCCGKIDCTETACDKCYHKAPESVHQKVMS